MGWIRPSKCPTLSNVVVLCCLYAEHSWIQAQFLIKHGQHTSMSLNLIWKHFKYIYIYTHIYVNFPEFFFSYLLHVIKDLIWRHLLCTSHAIHNKSMRLLYIEVCVRSLLSVYQALGILIWLGESIYIDISCGKVTKLLFSPAIIPL